MFHIKHLQIIAGCLAAIGLSSCQDKEVNVPREDLIEIYASPEEASKGEKPLDAVVVGVEGGLFEIYAKTSAEITASWQDALTSPWASVVSVEKSNSVSGLHVITLKVKRLSASAYYTRRTGSLIVGNREISLGKFVKVHQGSTARVSCNFDWLKYGAPSPIVETGETLIAAWSAAQKNYNFTSTPFTGESTAYCYGRNGHIKLGDDKGHGADIITPFADAMRADSLLMVSFKATAYCSESGVKDANDLTLEVTGGGVIRDYESEGRTSIAFQVPWFDANDPELATNMWKGADYLVFIKSTDTNPITANTQIRIKAGSLDKVSAKPNRIFVDNIYVRTLNGETDEDFFTENEGSGPDKILGVEKSEDNE